MFEIRELTGQTYVDSYATKKSEQLPTKQTTVMTAPTSVGGPIVEVGERPGSGNGDGRRSSADVLGRSRSA
jgi:hypothetical protein